MTWVSSSSDRSSSRERASATSFMMPLNHWLYDLMPNSIMRVANFRPALIRTEAWMGHSLSSVKFDFLSHPSAVVLSVIKRAQSWCLSHPAMMSTQGEMTAARCSRRLFEALNRKFSGRYHCHAQPLWLYPPNPSGHESKR